jgi:hypothetical protein
MFESIRIRNTDCARLQVLESLAEEDEEVVATWYLLGWMNFLRWAPLRT